MEVDGSSRPELADDFDDSPEPDDDDEVPILLLGEEVGTGSLPALGATLLASGLIALALVLSLPLLQFTYCDPVHGSLSSTQTVKCTVELPVVDAVLLRQSQLLSRHAEPNSEQSTKLEEPLETSV